MDLYFDDDENPMIEMSIKKESEDLMRRKGQGWRCRIREWGREEYNRNLF